MTKDGDAFRTISEVSSNLDVPQHVLRFWEGKFPQVAPLKRGGGRRYYRPDEVDLLKAIRKLLYEDGYTIRGVQRLLKDQGVRSVSLDHGQNVTALQPDEVHMEPPHEESDEIEAQSSSLQQIVGPPEPEFRLQAASLRRSLIDVARELHACRSILAAARSAATPTA